MPMVASPSPTLTRSPTPYCWKTAVRPARVPCPPLNDISSSAPALRLIPNTGSSRNQTRIPPTANWPMDITLIMMTCAPEMLQIVLTGGRCSPNRSEADIKVTSRPGSCLQTANTSSGKSPVPPRSRPIPSGPSPRTRNPPITAVGMKSLRNGCDQRRMSAAQAKTNERTTSDRATSSTLPGILNSLVDARRSGCMPGGADEARAPRASSVFARQARAGLCSATSQSTLGTEYSATKRSTVLLERRQHHEGVLPLHDFAGWELPPLTPGSPETACGYARRKG